MSAVLNLRGFTREEAARFKAQAAFRGMTLSRYLVWLTENDVIDLRGRMIGGQSDG